MVENESLDAYFDDIKEGSKTSEIDEELLKIRAEEGEPDSVDISTQDLMGSFSVDGVVTDQNEDYIFTLSNAKTLTRQGSNTSNDSPEDFRDEFSGKVDEEYLSNLVMGNYIRDKKRKKRLSQIQSGVNNIDDSVSALEGRFDKVNMDIEEINERITRNEQDIAELEDAVLEISEYVDKKTDWFHKQISQNFINPVAKGLAMVFGGLTGVYILQLSTLAIPLSLITILFITSSWLLSTNHE